MARKYIATLPHSAGAITAVSSSTGDKTLMQVGTPATTNIDVIGWGISCAGIVSTDAPGMVMLMDCDTGATAGTSLTPSPWGNPDDPASLCVGGTGATMITDGAVTEGTIGATSKLVDLQYIHPQTGYSLWYPTIDRPTIDLSRFLRIKTNFAVAINVIPWIVWSE